MMKLSNKQKAFLDYISRYSERWGTAPSFDEICSHFGFRSYNTVTTYLKVLERKGFIRLPSRKNLKRAIEILKPLESRRYEIPLLGFVAAGRPMEAVEDRRAVEVPASMTGKGEHFALLVKGDSMEDDGILDGDLVVVRRQPLAENGDTVVALIGNEVTVKRYYLRDDHVELRPAHKGMASIRVAGESLGIQGKVVGVMRRYP
ncbi:MAG: transcriptional repressor LexA [Desulfobacteraceae bacterium]|nr:MAG: transcriptional repressor LexA [Desulfobacteraceae bacterium]